LDVKQFANEDDIDERVKKKKDNVRDQNAADITLTQHRPQQRARGSLGYLGELDYT
jgi:hypothetical protein